MAHAPNAPNTHELVINASGLAARGSSLTSSLNTAPGTYDVVTDRTISAQCAAVATRGMPNAAVPHDPATVETTPGPAPNTFGVQTRLALDLSNGGNGTYKDEAFDIAVTC